VTAIMCDTQRAFWASIDEMPDDSLRRLVFADWMDEQGQPEVASALRATADRVPKKGKYGWQWRRDGEGKLRTPWRVQKEVFDAFYLLGHVYTNHAGSRWYRRETASSAVRNLCRAWIKVNC